jgi:hypothetical protein
MTCQKKFTALTRRQFLGTAGLGLIVRGRRKYMLDNHTLAFKIYSDKGAIAGRSFENRLTRQTFTLPSELFHIKFDDGSIISSSVMDLKYIKSAAGSIGILFSSEDGLYVSVLYTLNKKSHYLRKQISLLQKTGAGKRIIYAGLENWQGVKCGWNSPQPDALPYGSHPVWCETLWTGVEFVTAFNEFNPDGFILGSRPGGITAGPGWTHLHSTVTGVAEKGRARDSFLKYIDDIRISPPRMVACYNSWWTLPKVVRQSDNLALIKELRAGMYDRHGLFFDIVTTDMGWSNPRSIWEIDRSVLPQGFDDIRGIVEPAGGRLGIWMSPSETYPPVCDYEWAEKNGYTVVSSDTKKLPGARLGLSLADPKYRSETKEQLKKLIRENNLGHIKYDGFKAMEFSPHHNLLPGEDSVEPLAGYSLELLSTSKEADPKLVTEPTYMNSIYNYISPWIIKFSDTVWANAEDCVVGIGPAPEYRESHTNAREYMVFRTIDQIWLPQNAMQYFDIIHVDDNEGFANHAAMAFGRGRFFISTYLNPKLMSDDDWRIYIGLLRWAKNNSDILRNTEVIRSHVENGEPYLYAHWLENRGILAVRNPSNENSEYHIDLKKTGAPATLTDAVCYTQYPYRRGIADGLTGTSTFKVDLAPWELLFIEITEHAGLKETIAVGARWYRGADDSMLIVPDPGLTSVGLLEPGKTLKKLPVVTRQQDVPQGKLNIILITQLPESQWLKSKQRTTALIPFRYPMEPTSDNILTVREKEWKEIRWSTVKSFEFRLECSVTIPSGGSGRILLLVQFPGRNPCPSGCEAWIDGDQVKPEEKRSEEHIGYFDWKGELRQYESEWCWYICTVPAGSHSIRFKGKAGHPDPLFGLWLWNEYDFSGWKQQIQSSCSDPAMPQYRDHTERRGICLLKPKVKTI